MHIHPATFRGKHNMCKTKALLVLNDHKNSTSLSLWELAQLSTVSYEYLKSRLGQWHKWKYVNRHMSTRQDRPVFSYSIALRGIRFLTIRVPKPVLEQCRAELDEYEAKRRAAILERIRLMRAKFEPVTVG